MHLVTLVCKVCDTSFTRGWNKRHQQTCSRGCASTLRNNAGTARKAGLASAAKQASTRRSKNEMLFAALCAERFDIITNKPMFDGWDADVIIPSLKIAVLWNGQANFKTFQPQSNSNKRQTET